MIGALATNTTEDPDPNFTRGSYGPANSTFIFWNLYSPDGQKRLAAIAIDDLRNLWQRLLIQRPNAIKSRPPIDFAGDGDVILWADDEALDNHLIKRNGEVLSGDFRMDLMDGRMK